MKLPANPTNEHLDEFNSKQLFVRDALPSEWLSYSEELCDAAEALWTAKDQGMQVDMQTRIDGSASIERLDAHARSYILLVGLALENVLKALAIIHSPELIAQGKLGKFLVTHNLIHLVSRIPALPVSEQERRVLDICQDAIPYWGRYPVPLNYQGLKPKEAATPSFRSGFRSLHYRLCKTAYEKIKDGWDSGEGPKICKVRSARYGDKINPKESLPWARKTKGH